MALVVRAGEQNLIGVDVADPREDLLVHQGRLDSAQVRPSPAARPSSEISSARARYPRERQRRLLLAGEPENLAQSPRVAIPDHGVGFRQPKRQADVLRSGRLNQPKTSSHPGLDDDHSPLFGKRDRNPFSPASHLDDLHPPSAPRELLGIAALEQERIVHPRGAR